MCVSTVTFYFHMEAREALPHKLGGGGCHLFVGSGENSLWVGFLIMLEAPPPASADMDVGDLLCRLDHPLQILVVMILSTTHL